MQPHHYILYTLFQLFSLKIIAQQQFVITEFPNIKPPCGDASPWVKVYEDQFDGTTIDNTKWKIHTSHNEEGGGTLNDPNNIELGGGHMKIWAKKLPNPITKYLDDNGVPYPKTFKYSGGFVYSYEQSSWAYGKFEARIKIPSLYGLWPSFWLYNSKPEWNEIDIFEFWTHNYEEFCPIPCANPFNKKNIKNKNEKDQPRIHHMTVHKDIDGDGKSEFDHTKYKNPDYSQSFYIFSVEWDPYKIIWKVNGNTKRTIYKYHKLDGIGMDCENLFSNMLVLENKIFPTENMWLFFTLGVQHAYYHPQEFLNYSLPSLPTQIMNRYKGKEWHPELQPDEAPGGSDLPKYMLVDWVKIYKKDYCGKDLFISNKTYDDYEHEYLGGKNITFASLGSVILEPNTKVNTKAQERIYLKPGFHAKAGSYFRARIDPFCGNLRIASDSVENETENLIEEETIKTENNNIILINPNPSSGLFTLESEEPINPQQIEIYDIFGKRIQPTVNPNGNMLNINLSGYSKGMYFIKIGTYSQKMVVE
ncbi:MAG: family 16 glycosylhydrolase [Bacteroidetes bacterium]|nr:glycosyl hydrolase family protein [Bacteroidota bacterium]MBV6461381.1 hypothetical protein [Flavobacteriales bacterium]WKZ75218.1 MAG: family 16 glycosylhydrolase [Vicingaceae bacterium]MCL4816485.1 family 16 glycosylhydrolase [Flavobacteriales bacterium]NOG94419.1 family 16 glycosylhydrolase [Bacteroidota bacterium]